MNVWTTEEIDGPYGLGTTAVVVAKNAEDAAQLLTDQLAAFGVNQVMSPQDMVKVDTRMPLVRILGGER